MCSLTHIPPPLSARRFQKTELQDARVVFYGAGSSAVGVADSIATFMEHKAGISWEEARKRIYMVDSKGGWAGWAGWAAESKGGWAGRGCLVQGRALGGASAGAGAAP